MGYTPPMRKTFQYRLFPSKAQERKLDATLETCRRWWNDLLDERKTAWEERQESIGKTAQLQRVKLYRVSNPWAAEVHSHVLQVVVADLDKAFQAFFRRLKANTVQISKTTVSRNDFFRRGAAR